MCRHQYIRALQSGLKLPYYIDIKDVDVIFELEKQSVAAEMEEYFRYAQGDASSKIRNEEEMRAVIDYASKELDTYEDGVLEVADQIKEPRKKRKKRKPADKLVTVDSVINEDKDKDED